MAQQRGTGGGGVLLGLLVLAVAGCLWGPMAGGPTS